MFELIQFTEGTSSFFFSTGAQCVAGIAGLSGAVSTFHYQNLMGRIREKSHTLFEKYHPLGAGLKKELAEKYQKCRSIEEAVDFWRLYFAKEAKDGHQLLEFNDLFEIIRQTRKFRRAVIRNTMFGFLVILPVGILGTLEPAVPLFKLTGHGITHVLFATLLMAYFWMNLSLTRRAFALPWGKR